MDVVVEAVVEGFPATEADAVGGVDYGVDFEAGDVALPEAAGGCDYAFVGQLGLQLGVLCLEELVVERLWLPDVHQYAEEPLFVLEVGGYLGVSLVLPDEVLDAVVDVLDSVHGGVVVSG